VLKRNGVCEVQWVQDGPEPSQQPTRILGTAMGDREGPDRKDFGPRLNKRVSATRSAFATGVSLDPV